MAEGLTSLSEAVAVVGDGASVGLGRPAALSLARELVHQGRRNLRLVAAPTGSLGVELLIAGGCVRSIESSGVDLGEHGFAPAFTSAVERAEIEVIDSTCPALLMALQAGASGVAFTPVPGLIGSDLLRVRSDYKLVDDPYRPGQKVVLVPAIMPDFALVHGRRADGAGNAVIGIERDDRLLIQAARRVIMSVEEVRPDALSQLAADEQVIPEAFIDALVLAPSPAAEAEEVRRYLEERERAAVQP